MDSSGNLYGTTTVEAPPATARFSSWPRAAARSPRWPRSTAPTVPARSRPDHGQQRQSVRHNAMETAVPNGRRHGFRAGPWQRHDHHAGLRSTAPTVQFPHGGLIMDSSGNLYGTTGSEAHSGDGTVFELANGSQHDHHAGSFNGTNGRFPYGGVIMDSSGNLYGTRPGEAPPATARFSSWPRAAARSPRWSRSAAPTVPIRMPA